MPDTNHSTPNPSERKREIALDYAISELHGAASAACAVLLALRNDVPLPLGDATSNEAIAWMEGKLSSASENVRALHSRDAPRWNTFRDASEIGPALNALRYAEEDAAE